MFTRILKKFKEKQQLTQAEKTLIFDRVAANWQKNPAQQQHVEESVPEKMPVTFFGVNFKRYFLTLSVISLVFLGVLFYLTEPQKYAPQYKTNLSLLTAGDQVTTTKSVDFNSKNIILDFEIAGPVDAGDALTKLTNAYENAKTQGNLMYGRYETYSQDPDSPSIIKDEIELWYDLQEKRYKIIDIKYLDEVFSEASVTLNDGSNEYVYKSTDGAKIPELSNKTPEKISANPKSSEYLYDLKDPLAGDAALYKLLSSTREFEPLVLVTIDLSGQALEAYKIAYSFPYRVWDGDRFSEEQVRHVLYLDAETLLPIKETFEPNIFPTKYFREVAYLQVDQQEKDSLFSLSQVSLGPVKDSQKSGESEQDEAAVTGEFAEITAEKTTVAGKLLVQNGIVLLEACDVTYIVKGSELFDLLHRQPNLFAWMLNNSNVLIEGSLITAIDTRSAAEGLLPELVSEKISLTDTSFICLESEN